MDLVESKHAAIRKVLNTLRKALGTSEHPPGSNHNFITVWYNQHVAQIGDGAWCQMTDTWSVWSSGFKELLTGTAWTVQAALNAQKGLNGSTWHTGTKGMKKGDQVYYDWSGGKSISGIDHTGTVEKINSDHTFYTLEGNCSDALRRVKRDGKFVVGYVRHDWSKVVKPPEHHDPKPVHHEPTPVHHEPPPVHHEPAPIHHEPAPTEPPKDLPPKEIIKGLQRLFGIEVDGVWGDQTDRVVMLFRTSHRTNKA